VQQMFVWKQSVVGSKRVLSVDTAQLRAMTNTPQLLPLDQSINKTANHWNAGTKHFI